MYAAFEEFVITHHLWLMPMVWGVIVVATGYILVELWLYWGLKEVFNKKK